MHLLFPALLVVCTHPSEPGEYAFHHEGVIGTFLELRVQADSEAAARAAEAVVLKEVDRLTSIFSGYDEKSAYSKWSATYGTPESVPTELFELLEASDHWRTLTAGAFDPRVDALSRLWREAARAGTPPSETDVDHAIARMRPLAWALDRNAKTATRLGDCPLTFDGIATGTIVDRAAAVASRIPGVSGLMLNIGGDLAVCGNLASLVAIPDPAAEAEYAPPLALLAIRDKAVTTSGRSERDFRVGGRRYSHILDPRTGQPADGVLSATAIAPTCEAADALATALAVLPVAEGLRLIEALPGCQCLIIEANGARSASAGWKSLLAQSPEAAAVSANESPFEMLVRLDINKPAGETRYRRPYIAVWLENEEGFPVRTISLLVSFGGPGPKWIDDLKRWYKSDKDRQKVDKTDRLYTVSKSTRPPGKFEIIWDGKDDQGKVLPDGEYTLYIEAAREHGTYQLIRVPVKFEGKSFAADPEGNIEIKSAHVEYREKAAKP
jgi:FAD:protein FMN transferase